MNATRTLLALTLMVLFSSSITAASDTKQNQIMAGAIVVREAEDQAWELQIKGEIPSLCGAYIIVYDTEKKVIYQGVIPSGKYPHDKPYVITIPKDGIKGDYMVKIIGSQDDLLGISYPISNQQEVYKISSTTIGHEKGRHIFFRTPPDQQEQTVAAYKDHLYVEDETGTVVAHTQNGKYGGDDRNAKYRYCNYITFPVDPAKIYALYPQAFYFRLSPAIFATFTPDRWFYPTAKLEKVNWWELDLK